MVLANGAMSATAQAGHFSMSGALPRQTSGPTIVICIRKLCTPTHTESSTVPVRVEVTQHSCALIRVYDAMPTTNTTVLSRSITIMIILVFNGIVQTAILVGSHILHHFIAKFDSRHVLHYSTAVVMCIVNGDASHWEPKGAVDSYELGGTEHRHYDTLEACLGCQLQCSCVCPLVQSCIFVNAVYQRFRHMKSTEISAVPAFGATTFCRNSFSPNKQ